MLLHDLDQLWKTKFTHKSYTIKALFALNLNNKNTVSTCRQGSHAANNRNCH